MEYNFREIEKKWQKRWVENKTYQVTEDETKQKYYVLNMFPYPSGARGTSIGIHRFGHLCPLQTPARFQCPEPHGIRCLRPAGRTICHTDGTAPRNHHRQQYQPLSRAVGQDRFLLRLEPRNPHLRPGILPLDAMGFPKDVQQLLLQLLRIGKTHRPTDRAL